METLSFILGIAFVVVIAVAIVAVYAFVKVGQIKEELNSIHQVIGSEIDSQNRLRESNRRDFENVVSDIYRTIDSRLDKLENKISEQIKK